MICVSDSVCFDDTQKGFVYDIWEDQFAVKYKGLQTSDIKQHH